MDQPTQSSGAETAPTPRAFKYHMGAVLRRARISIGHSMERIALDLGVSSQTIGNYELGETQISFEMLRALSDRLSIHPVVAYTQALALAARSDGRGDEQSILENLANLIDSFLRLPTAEQKRIFTAVADMKLPLRE
mgnify:CR=1 FL=1